MNAYAADIKTHTCDILVAGAGFAGSLTALCLHRCGFDVCLVEKERHPRFAIGESSTPIADMILRGLSSTYDLPWLYPFSRYGSWQESHPEIPCGIKRGFSYFRHRPGKPFTTDANHSRELLVAASARDADSDTHWLRSDFDAFLVDKVREYGIPYFDRTEIVECRNESPLEWRAESPQGSLRLRAEFFVDATGSPHLNQHLFQTEFSLAGFRTRSRAVYSHFEDVPRWKQFLTEAGIPTSDYPFDPDHSALHHLLNEGWLWMLRFNNGRTSIGLVVNEQRGGGRDISAVQQWDKVISAYPSLRNLLEDAVLSREPGGLIATGRLQRKLSDAHGTHWAALPHTAGFVDPLHSTGIAHTLSGIEKLVRILSDHLHDTEQLQRELENYQKGLFEELEFVDMLVGGCYEVLDRFELFNIWSMLYFTAAIHYEQKRLQGEIPSHFLDAGNRQLAGIVRRSYGDLLELAKGGAKHTSRRQIRLFREKVKKRIAPYNLAGLLDAENANMYRHTVAEL